MVSVYSWIQIADIDYNLGCDSLHTASVAFVVFVSIDMLHGCAIVFQSGIGLGWGFVRLWMLALYDLDLNIFQN